MGKYRRGAIIKLMRKSLDLTQEQLIEGLCCDICSLKTLSRVENGKQNIKESTYKLLMERMGAIVSKTEPLLSTDELILFEDYEILHMARVEKRYDEAEKILDKISCTLDMLYPINRQYYLENKAQIDYKLNKIDEITFLVRLEEAIKYTIKNFNQISLAKWPFTIQEATIIMNMAIAYYNSGNRQKAIELLYDLKNALEQEYIDRKSMATIWLSIVSNLASFMGNIGKLNKSIDLDVEALEFSKNIDNGALVAGFLYDLMWNKKEIMKNSNENKEDIKKMEKSYLKKAYHIARAMDDLVEIEFLRGKIEKL